MSFLNFSASQALPPHPLPTEYIYLANVTNKIVLAKKWTSLTIVGCFEWLVLSSNKFNYLHTSNNVLVRQGVEWEEEDCQGEIRGINVETRDKLNTGRNLLEIYIKRQFILEANFTSTR